MMYALVISLILSFLFNLYLMRALGREYIKRTQLEEGIMAIKIQQDFDRFMESRYNNEREPGGNLQ
jgi:hypothetical protein